MEKLSCAVCIVGQLARLELESKLQYVVKPNLLSGRTMALFMVLARGKPKFVNARAENATWSLVAGPFARYNRSQLEGHILDTLSNAIAGMHASHQGRGLGFSMHTYFASEARKFLEKPLWAGRLDKAERGLKANSLRQQMHLLQWEHLRKCMFMIDRREQDARMHFKLVLKLRDDSMALLPMYIPSYWPRVGLISLQCLGYGGIMDATFAVGRRWAWNIMEGMSAEWYLSHYDFSSNLSLQPGRRIPHNPESWLAALAKMKAVPVRFMEFCMLPFVSVRLVANATSTPTYMTKRLHSQLVLTHNSSCFLRNTSRGGIHKNTCARRIRTELHKLTICPRAICNS